MRTCVGSRVPSEAGRCLDFWHRSNQACRGRVRKWAIKRRFVLRRLWLQCEKTVPMTTRPDERTLEDVALPDVVEGFTKRRVELVQRAVKEWAAALIDLGGRNNLLRYRDLKVGTLDLTNASPKAVAALLQGRPIKTSSLFTDPDERDRWRVDLPLGTTRQ
jgi:hypothetical protein